MSATSLFPFSAIVGQDDMRLALVLAAVDPSIGGVLIRGEKGTAKSTVARALARHLPQGRMLTLPLGVTEDRVVGGLDLERTLKQGAPVFTPGLLAAADGGILYVDEVNLLDEHIADLTLDAAASGRVLVEREGFSAAMDARFCLVGTMNPEEGALRPQLIDRFGLCVDVSGETDLQRRALIVRRRLDFERDPRAFIEHFRAAEERLGADIRRARSAHVQLSAGTYELIAQVAQVSGAAGHRAELTLAKAACALAALRGNAEAGRAEVTAVTDLVLAHRARAGAEPEDRAHYSGHPPDRNASTSENDRREQPARTAQQPPAQQASEPGAALQAETRPAHDAGEPASETGKPHAAEPGRGQGGAGKHAAEASAEPRVSGVGESYAVRNLEAAASAQTRARAGKRQEVASDDGRGRYVSSRPTDQAFDLAFDATLRAAAPYQRARRARLDAGDPRAGMAVLIHRADWRRKVRTRKAGSLVLICVDASGSMGAKGRMLASKGAVLSLLLDAYVKRDQVGLVAFGGNGARVLVPPTSSIELAQSRLEGLATGGRTPLAAGLAVSAQLAEKERNRHPGLSPLIVLVTDGRANVTLSGEVSRSAGAEARELARAVGQRGGASWVVVDTERPAASRGDARSLAAALHARYLPIAHLRADDLLGVVHTFQGE
ncbi:hypothetical protein CATYP_00710 [Corynebacterium atypicum]|uniref:VWFA domain-containing protein n=1 Tax=Corynebacterium atypicum TaxID=191610 RepID=A0ABN4DB91_9CORY|nr:VWA domain-containing protein [Corynebacterium atypicum]AIG63455.1 hypothetical protein CATYP_00710 [Corynebacterium atypicum]